MSFERQRDKKSRTPWTKLILAIPSATSIHLDKRREGSSRMGQNTANCIAVQPHNSLLHRKESPTIERYSNFENGDT